MSVLQLTSQQKSQLKNFINSNQWLLIVQLAEEYCQKIKNNSSIRDSQWETLKETIKQEGQIEGIKNFLQEIFLQIE